MITKEEIQNLKTQIALGDIDHVLKQLNQSLEGSSHHNDIIMISGRLANLQKQVRMGIISQSQATLTNNQINASLIDFLDQLDKNNSTTNQTPTNQSGTTIIQKADKIYNIDNIDNANFS